MVFGFSSSNGSLSCLHPPCWSAINAHSSLNRMHGSYNYIGA